MCGITGIYAFNELGKFFQMNLVPATNAITSRGPDQQGTVIYNRVGFGHRRLSIIDTSLDGKQPMESTDGRYTIIFNGEIYNFKALKAQLGNDVTYRSQTDTEVLLNLYIKYGKDCLSMLNGFFAFAILNKESGELFIARDRYGIKPLLVYQDEDKLIFASEMKSLMAWNIPKVLDYHSLSQYLQLNYIPQPHSIFKNVRKLQPGHYLKIYNKEVQEQPYYEIPYDRETAENYSGSYEAQKTQLTELIKTSVQKRMIADVPLGTFLSGGIDSSVITALASRYTDKLHTFSIGYKDEPFFDETKYALSVAKRYNTEHTTFSLSNNDLLEHLHSTLDYIDEPFADSSALAVNILSHHTRKHVTVALSGDGADELFAGYNKYMAEWKARHGGVKASLVKMLYPVWKMLPKSRNSGLLNTFRQLERFAEGMKLSDKDRYYRWCSFLTRAESNALFSAATLEKVSAQILNQRQADITQHITQGSNINDILRSDMDLVLPGDMLTKVDLMSMNNSLEVRVPFLDHEVVNFAFSIPESSKINGQMKKRIVQDAFRDMLPEELYNRPKHGFEVPLLGWFRNELRYKIESEWLSEGFIRDQGIFDYEQIHRLKKQLFSSSPGDVHAQIWALIVFQNWYKKYGIKKDENL